MPAQQHVWSCGLTVCLLRAVGPSCAGLMRRDLNPQRTVNACLCCPPIVYISCMQSCTSRCWSPIRRTTRPAHSRTGWSRVRGVGAGLAGEQAVVGWWLSCTAQAHSCCAVLGCVDSALCSSFNQPRMATTSTTAAVMLCWTIHCLSCCCCLSRVCWHHQTTHHCLAGVIDAVAKGYLKNMYFGIAQDAAATNLLEVSEGCRRLGGLLSQHTASCSG